MAVPVLISALQATALARWVSGASDGAEWVFPAVETIHVMAVATLYGTIAMVDLRMLGFTSRNVRMSDLTNEVLSWTWTAFAFAAISGSLMFISNAEMYWNNLQARAKFLCIALAGVNMAIYQLGMHRRISEWDTRLPPPVAVRTAGALSIALWTSVIFFGRWMGFTI